MSLLVSGLCAFPVKSLAATPVDELAFSARGAFADRRWMLVDEAGKFVTQRQFPQLCRIHAESADEHGVYLKLHCLTSDQSVMINADQLCGAERTQVQVWGDSVEALDAGDEISAWFSSRLKATVRLVYFPAMTHRQVDLKYAQPGDDVGFADGFPVLIANMASLRVLQGSLADTGWKESLSMWRFRPNIVVDGGAAFAENNWSRLRIGDMELELVKPCSRCAIPTIRLEDGVRQKEVFQVLRQHCLGDDGEVYFGQNALLRFKDSGSAKTSLLTVGMPVEVLS
ncbi:MOSC N-terminal beta barrel domain-containing protein [Spongiibacter sp. KMU-158]|uniref:MOSC N-terminal beta barrel domain-containing protein n=1 Tax=Spongiibacter pelagi TaxID=2760804 RepID=A0A927C2N4_9GAMM|nr:MOSC N-terminal beta barrel domain-containing protein [Spongiibacter pelagi]MBD2858521.1 MOSC N-terminal beta barrel domain-containing protein [Spongiibacter pelagi]